MKRSIIIAAVLVVFAVIPVAADEFELGISATPIFPAEDITGSFGPETNAEMAPGFQFGYRFFGLLYADWHGIILPPQLIERMTGFYDAEANVDKVGIFRPGFLNTWNVGGKINIGPFVGFGTIGVNTIYVYRQSDLIAERQEFNRNFGANFRFGVGLRGDDFGVNFSLMGVFPDLDTMFSDLAVIFGDDPVRAEAASNRIPWFPSLTAIWYL